MVECGDLDAGQLFIHVALCERALEFLENVVTNQHLGGRDISHSAKKADIQREYLENIEIFIEFERVLDFGDAVDLVDEPGVFEPGVQAGNPR